MLLLIVKWIVTSLGCRASVFGYATTGRLDYQGPDELQAAEVKVLSLVQEERFEEELKFLEG